MNRNGYYDTEFKMLNHLIGKKVTCIFWDKGVLKGIRGIIEDVSNYDYINIEEHTVYFLNEDMAIEYILFEDKMIVYNNYRVCNYQGVTNKDELKSLQNNILGIDVEEQLIKKRI